MNALERWEQGNDAHLAAALHWLRLRLLTHIQASAEIPAPPPRRRHPWWQRLFPCLRRRPAQEPSLPAAAVVSAEELARARRAMEEAERQEPPPALLQLAQRLGMSRFERELLLLCASLELDPAMASLCARAQGSAQQPWPSFALALKLLDEPAWDSLSPERPLRHWRLLEIHQPGAQPLTASALRADERIVNFLKGLNQLDERLSALVQPLETDPMPLPPSQEALAARLSESLRHSRGAELPVLQLLGTDGASQQRVAQRLARDLGLWLHRLPVDQLPAQAAELETLVRLWQRETLLLPVALLLEGQAVELAGAGEGAASALRRFLARGGGLTILSSREALPDPGRATLLVDIARPTSEEQREIWREALGEQAGSNPTRLAAQFDLNAPAIREIAARVLAETPEAATTPLEEEVLAERLWEGCLRHSRPQFDGLAQRLELKASWADLVLPETQETLLRQIAEQVRMRHRVVQEWGFAGRLNRGLGISALFAGDSGTGKTMAAEVIANDLRLDLYRIDLSAVMNKYIGETEKNLRKVFDAAEDGRAILFFDEADALFSRRGEGGDNLQHFANLQIDYLLQRMEAFAGLAILATNLRSSIDPAFERRLRFIVNFEFPSLADRERIWRGVFPAQAPTKELHHGRLARLNLSGGSIQNVALNAAFLAASSGGPVTMELVLQAAREEYRKLNRPLNEAEFRWQEPAGARR